ncbi:hypothetical protein V5O48_010365 [Marasmius crinis-equi]|uniref:Uncharacterized protein n=1 Tax=Marasmius crinis-equi TaxID=585013 RepID=A0ABR3F8L3_9AGAR
MQPPESTMPFLETIHRIIHDHRTLLKRLALVLASKGYAPLLSPLLLPTILRMNQPEPARLFLREYERLDEKYQWERPPGVSELRLVAPEMRVAISLKAIRESAVRVLTDLGQLDFAFGLISSDDTREIRLNRRTYGHLLAALEKRRAYLVGQDVFSSKKLTKLDALMTKVQLMFDEASDQALPLAGLETQMPLVHTITTTTQLVEAIRLVKAALPFNTGLRENKRRLDGPTIVQILAVLSSPETVLANDSGYREHVAASRPNLLRLLRRRALLSTERSTKIWLFSEMVHLWHLRRYEEIIKLFEVHFWCYGVPIIEIARIANAMPDPWDHRWARDLFRGIPEKGILPKPKFYPTAYHHTSIVWQSLVMTHEDNKGKIASLYRTMVQYAGAYQEASKQLHEDSEESELDAPYKAPIGLDSDSDSFAFPIISQENPLICVENFTPFIRQLSAGGSRPDLQRSDLDPTQIMRDMMNLKMRPTIHQFTELARRYVLNSDGPRALKILDHLEVINFQEPPLRTADDTAANPSRARDSSLPEPDIICYIALMRAFLRMNDLEGVEEVDRRLKIRYGSLEELLAGLEKRKQTERVKEDVITINEVYRDWELLEAWNSKNVEGAPVMAV